jgi:excinuclease UvrABC nuclease subunit
MNNFLENLGMNFDPEGKKNEQVSNIEESDIPIKSEVRDEEKFLKEMEDSFDESIADSTHDVLDYLDNEINKAEKIEDFETAKEVKSKIDKLL